MVNSVETTHSSTTVPLMSLPHNQCQEQATDSLLSLLAALLAHSAFAQGVHECQEYFCDFYDEVPLTEEEMIEAVEINLSRHSAVTAQHFATIMGWNPPSYLRDLGWVVGIIAKGLTYQQGQR